MAAWMSACGGKADVEWCREESPLMTHSGHCLKSSIVFVRLLVDFPLVLAQG